MKIVKKCIAYFLIFVFVIQSANFDNVVCEAANSYFVSGNLYCHKIAKNKVEVCGVKKAKGTLMIPEKVSYKGKKYKVTGIADMEYVDEGSLYHSADENKEALDAPGYHYYYAYFDKKMGSGVLPDDIKELPTSNITKVILPKTLTYIGEGAFNGCRKLKKVVFAESYHKLVIGKHAFSGEALKSLKFPEGTCELRDFSAGKVPEITIPASVKNIGTGVVNCYTEKVKISKKNKNFKMKSGILYTYNEKTLLGASAITGKKVKISSKTTKVAEQAFWNCKVSKVELRGNVREISKGAFAFCSNLKQVTGTEQVEQIGYAGFYECENLTDIGKLSNIKEIAEDAFAGVDKISLRISSATDVADQALSGARRRTNIRVTVPENDPVYSIENGLLLKKGKEGKTVLMQTENMEKVVIPEGVSKLSVAIGDNEICTEVLLPESLKLQESWIYINAGTITYQAREIPEFRGHFFIKNGREKNTVILVPSNTLQGYKEKMEKAAKEGERELMEDAYFFDDFGLELREFLGQL